METEVGTAHQTATAIRIMGTPPQLDGVLADNICSTAPLHGGFLQRDPDEGKPASERTTFQVAYDDEALYFGSCGYDSEPHKIVSRVVRGTTTLTRIKFILFSVHITTNRSVSGLLPIRPVL